MGVLLVIVIVHPAAGVAGLLVAYVERVVSTVKKQRHLACDEIAMALRGPALAAAGDELSDWQADGNTGLAAIAMGPISENAAAPKTSADQGTVNRIVDQVSRRCDLRTRLPLGQITARIW